MSCWPCEGSWCTNLLIGLPDRTLSLRRRCKLTVVVCQAQAWILQMMSEERQPCMCFVGSMYDTDRLLADFGIVVQHLNCEVPGLQLCNVLTKVCIRGDENNQVPGCTWPPSLNQTHEPICSLQVKPWSVHNRLKQLSDNCALIHAAHECGICMASRADNKVSICVPATLIINECSRTAYCNCRLLHHYQGLQKWLAYADTMHHLIVMRPRHILLSILSALWVLSA